MDPSGTWISTAPYVKRKKGQMNYIWIECNFHKQIEIFY